MNNKIVMLSEQFEKDDSGEHVEGITIMIDGMVKQFLGIVLQKSHNYSANMDIIQDALIKGLEQIKSEIM